MSTLFTKLAAVELRWSFVYLGCDLVYYTSQHEQRGADSAVVSTFAWHPSGLGSISDHGRHGKFGVKT